MAESDAQVIVYDTSAVTDARNEVLDATDSQTRQLLDDSSRNTGEILNGLETVSQQLVGSMDALSGEVAVLGEKVDSASAANDAKGSEVQTVSVVLDSSLQERFDSYEIWLHSSFGVLLFLSLVCTLLVASLLGNRLWNAFSEGWKR